MEQPEIRGLIGERLREAGTASNLPVSALNTTGPGRPAGWLPRPVELLLRRLDSAVRGLRAGPLRANRSRVLDTSVHDGVRTQVVAVELAAGSSYVHPGPGCGATTQVMVTRGHLHATTPQGDTVLAAGQSAACIGTVRAAGDAPAAAILVVSAPR